MRGRPVHLPPWGHARRAQLPGPEDTESQVLAGLTGTAAVKADASDPAGQFPRVAGPAFDIEDRETRGGAAG